MPTFKPKTDMSRSLLFLTFPYPSANKLYTFNGKREESGKHGR